MSLWSANHLAATGVYALLTVVLLVRGKTGRHNIAFAAAAACTAVWSLTQGLAGPSWQQAAASTLRDGSWIAFLLLLIRSESASARFSMKLGAAAACLLLADLALANSSSFSIAGLRPGGGASRMAVAAFGLLLVENLLRNVSRERFWAFKLLGIGLSIPFLFNLVLEIPHLFMDVSDARFLAAQPLIYIMIAPLLIVSAVRMPKVGLRLHSSRKVAFHSATLFAAGVLMEGMALAAVLVRRYGGTEGLVLELVLLFAGAAIALTAAASAQLRSHIRTFINENFFSYKYDYRAEWGRFIQSLSERDEDSAPQRALRTLADLMDCPGGLLLARRDGNRNYQPAASWAVDMPEAQLAADSEVLAALAPEDLAFIELSPEKKNQSPASDWAARYPFAWLVVPLRYRKELVGVVLLCPPRAQRRLDWEDRNLIALVAQQLAVYLVQDDVTRALADARQLEEFNRRIAFAAHDLKNSIGQLTLVARNAERFWDEPRFRSDMVVTIRRSAEQLQELMARLKGETIAASPPSRMVDLRVLLSDFVNSKRTMGLSLSLSEMPCTPMMAEVDAGALLNVLEHVVANAVESSPGNSVELGLHRSKDGLRLSVRDRGEGMSQRFVNEELFRPLRSSKSSGFGIGAYQARQTMRDLHGDLEVCSTLGAGTTVQLVLPCPGKAA